MAPRGNVGAVALSGAVRALLFEVSPTDPLALGAAVALLLATGLAASALPASLATPTPQACRYGHLPMPGS